MTRSSFHPEGTVASTYTYSSPRADVRSGGAASLVGSMAALAAALDIDDAIFFLAWELLGFQPKLDTPQDQRAALMLLLATLVATKQGSSCLPLPHGLSLVLSSILSPQVRELLGLEAEDELVSPIMRLVEGGRLDALVSYVGDERFTPLVLDAHKLYHQRMHHHESRLIEALTSRFGSQTPSIQTDGISDLLDLIWDGPHSMSLTPEQRYAVLTAAHLPWTVITGGPGTGKTSIIVAILRLMVRLGVDPAHLALAAPTGKAANRMIESIEHQLHSLGTLTPADASLLQRLAKPKTLHRLLGYSKYSGNYLHHEHHPIDARLLVIDEASMIDMFLMERLLRALAPDTHVIFLGDVDQLPSVDAGAVLRDVAHPHGHTLTPWLRLLDVPPPERTSEHPRAHHTVHLTTSWRMRHDDQAGRSIALASSLVRQGEADSLLSEQGPLQRLEDVDASILADGACWLDGSHLPPDDSTVRAHIREICSAWQSRHGLPHAQARALSDRVLQPLEHDMVMDQEDLAHVRRAFASVHGARLLALTHAWATGVRTLNEMMADHMRRMIGASNLSFVPGMPVMMSRNDYGRDIFNGDQGIVLPGYIDGRRELLALFTRGDGFVGFEFEALRAHLQMSFAMTVHKAQGSEFDSICLILPWDPIPLLTREVVYTAMTRARHSALIVGTRTALHSAVHTRMQRYSGLENSLIS